MIESFRDLTVWKRAMDFTVQVYSQTEGFLKYALGSEAELHTQIELARRLNMLSQANTTTLLQDLSGVGRMLTALLQALPRD